MNILVVDDTILPTVLEQFKEREFTRSILNGA